MKKKLKLKIKIRKRKLKLKVKRRKRKIYCVTCSFVKQCKIQFGNNYSAVINTMFCIASWYN
jgi:hypothetical protein